MLPQGKQAKQEKQEKIRKNMGKNLVVALVDRLFSKAFKEVTKNIKLHKTEATLLRAFALENDLWAIWLPPTLDPITFKENHCKFCNKKIVPDDYVIVKFSENKVKSNNHFSCRPCLLHILLSMED